LSGKLQGYLAYADGLLVGWCNANDKSLYPYFDLKAEISDFIRGNNYGRVKSTICFCIALEYRGKGIATALLKRIIHDAQM